MKCLACKVGETKDGETTVTLDKGGVTLVVRNVPAEVCRNCGEAYLSEATTKRLDQTAAEASRAGVQVDVRKYVAA